MIVRPAQPADGVAIGAIWNHVIRTSAATFNSVEKTAEDIARAMADNPAFLVAVQDDTVLGFATYAQFRGGAGYRHTMEHTIQVADAAKGRGVGRALMQAIEDHARAGGAHTIFAGVSGENPAGIGFHAALGYAQVARLPEVGFKFGRWMDLVLMQKRL